MAGECDEVCFVVQSHRHSAAKGVPQAALQAPSLGMGRQATKASHSDSESVARYRESQLDAQVLGQAARCASDYLAGYSMAPAA